MSCSETDSHETLAAVVDALRRETQRLTALGDVLGQSESDWFGRFEQLEEARRRTGRSRRKLAIRAVRLRRQRAALAAARGAPGAGGSGGAAEADLELTMLRAQLAEAAEMLESLRDARRTADADYRAELEELRGQIERHEATELELREALEVLRSATGEDESDDSGRPLQAIREQLRREQIRSEELETQNASLATQLAAAQVHGQTTGAMTSQMHESLSWEERKAAILQQLHREDADEPLDAGERESLRDVVAKTDREIQKRDAEIAELQQLLEHQSTAVGDSVAVGAAAIAQMIDADDLVREEREKLQAIKAEWQDKLRQAEIDLSLERAKLARERRELEQKHADLEQQLAEAAELRRDATPADQPRRRRWLTQLGLSDEE